MMTDDTVLLRKAQEIIVSDLSTYGGILQAATTEKFFVRLIEKSKLLGMADVQTMKGYRQLLPAFKFDAQFLTAGTEAAALADADADKPTFTQPELNAKLFRGLLPITDEALEDNIERKTLVPHILSELPNVVARDIDDVMINGNTAYTTALTTAAALKRKRFLRQLNGLVAQIATNTYEADESVVNIDQIESLIAAMPNEYKDDAVIEGLKLFMPIQAVRSYRNRYAHRMTPGGDMLFHAGEGRMKPGYDGIEIIGVAKMPVASNLGTAILVNPTNIKVGFWRQVTLETFRDPRAGMNYIVCSLRMDVTLQDEAAAACMTKFAVS